MKSGSINADLIIGAQNAPNLHLGSYFLTWYSYPAQNTNLNLCISAMLKHNVLIHCYACPYRMVRHQYTGDGTLLSDIAAKPVARGISSV